MQSSSAAFGGRVLLVAFEGWNDAAEAATSAVKMIVDEFDMEPVAVIDPEEYAEFHYARPQVYFDEDGTRQIRWPSTEFLVPSDESKAANPKAAKIQVLLGVEPALRWRSFTEEILEVIEDREIDSVLFVGAMLADAPHTRPIQVMASSQNEQVREHFGVEKSDYEGPVGILTVLAQALETTDVPCVSLWAQVPHYVHQSPSPKVTLALLIEIERILGISVDHGELAEEAFTWERGIDELAESDEDMASYINQLEKSADEMQSTKGSGDVLAQEFEKFLRDTGAIGTSDPDADVPKDDN